MFALGICNTIGAFVSSMPVTGSFTRSAVNNASGVRTTLAGIFTSSLLLLSIAFLTPSFYYVPKATLAAIIICAMIYLFDWGAFTLIWRTKSTHFCNYYKLHLLLVFRTGLYPIFDDVSVQLVCGHRIWHFDWCLY